MNSFGDTKTTRNVTLSMTNFSYSIINPVPWGAISFNFQLFPQSSSFKINGRDFDTYFQILPQYFQLEFRNIPLLSGYFTFYSHYIPMLGTNISLNVHIPIDAISFVESQRNDDVEFTGRLVFWYKESVPDLKMKLIDNDQCVLNFQYKFSQKDWIDLLSKINYEDIWLIEITKPKIEGFHEVTEHIQKAYEALYNKKEPEDVIRDLRAAKDSFKTFYDVKKEKIFEIIDRGSSGDSGNENKSKRIDKIFVDIGNFLNIGPHNDKYKVSYADALLAYREFISVIAYLSSILKEVKEG